MSPDLLTGAAAILLSLVFSYVPGLNVKFAGLGKEVKQLIMLGLIVIVAGVVYGLGCAGVLTDLTGIVMACDKSAALGLLRAVGLAIIANQSVFAISPLPEAVRVAKYGKVE